jgi:hypothetical protein
LNALAPAESRRRRQLLRILEDIEAVLPESAPVPGAQPAATISDCARWARLARRARRGLARLDRRAAELEEELALVQRYQGFFSVFESLLAAGSPRPGFSAFHVVLRADQRDSLPALRRALGEMLGEACDTLDRELPGGETAVLLLVPASRAAAVEQPAQTRAGGPVPGGYGPTLLQAVADARLGREIPAELRGGAAGAVEALSRPGRRSWPRAGCPARPAGTDGSPRPHRRDSHVFVLDGCSSPGPSRGLPARSSVSWAQPWCWRPSTGPSGRARTRRSSSITRGCSGRSS